MEFPPPPSLVFLSWMDGSITVTEFESLLNLWEEARQSDTQWGLLEEDE